MSNIITGYGINVSKLTHEIDGAHLLELIKTAPKLFARMKKDFEEEFTISLEDTSEEDYSYAILTEWVHGYENYCYGGLAAIMQEVIEEIEGIELSVEMDFDGDDYLVYTAKYPWDELNEKEKELTEDSLKALIEKYLSIATPESLYPEYLTIEAA